jgi:aerobic-type carbon monoxide dehydrogenase small subunit (CoxS/CutS family)
MIMAVEGLLREHPDPGEPEIRDYLSGNLCRCGTYSAVIAAVQAVANQTRERHQQSSETAG